MYLYRRYLSSLPLFVIQDHYKRLHKRMSVLAEVSALKIENIRLKAAQATADAKQQAELEKVRAAAAAAIAAKEAELQKVGGQLVAAQAEAQNQRAIVNKWVTDYRTLGRRKCCLSVVPTCTLFTCLLVC
jgi:hypothetical protein